MNNILRNVKAVLFPADASAYMEKLGMRDVAENTRRKKINRAILKFVLTGIPGVNGRSVTKNAVAAGENVRDIVQKSDVRIGSE